MQKAVLEIKNLWVEVGERIVLRSVNLSIGKGIYVMMGPNAAGKSSLLKTIAGDPRYKIKKGEIIFEGKIINNLPPWERVKLGIVYCYQNPPKLSIRFKRLAEMIGKKELINKFDVEYLLERFLFDGFSGGESKRVELFLSLSLNPKLLLLDEPDSGVDVDTIRKLAKIIESLNSTIILVTHSGLITKELKKIERVFVMKDGKIVLEGDKSIIEKVLSEGYERV